MDLAIGKATKETHIKDNGYSVRLKVKVNMFGSMEIVTKEIFLSALNMEVEKNSLPMGTAILAHMKLVNLKVMANIIGLTEPFLKVSLIITVGYFKNGLRNGKGLWRRVYDNGLIDQYQGEY